MARSTISLTLVAGLCAALSRALTLSSSRKSAASSTLQPSPDAPGGRIGGAPINRSARCLVQKRARASKSGMEGISAGRRRGAAARTPIIAV